MFLLSKNHFFFFLLSKLIIIFCQALYGRLFYVLQRETQYLARLTRLVSLGEIDNLLQTVMFTLYGNQYEAFEEHLLLALFGAVLQAEFAAAPGTIGELLSFVLILI